MEILIKIAAIAITGTVIGLVIKKNSPEMSLLLTISIAMVALYMASGIISDIVDFAGKLADASKLSPAVLSVLLKTVGISIISRLASDVCRDAGQTSVASGVEIAGCAAALYISLPLMETVFDMISSLM